MSKKEECKAIILELFGPASAAQIDNLSEEECVEKCRSKVEAFLGKNKAKLFDNLD